MLLRHFHPDDTEEVVALWQRCELLRPWNDPYLDIKRKMGVDPELFWVGEMDGCIMATAMGGYEGHRGWVNYLAIDPDYQRRGFGRLIMEKLETELLARGCPKLNLQLRADNETAVGFYTAIGYQQDAVISLGKRLIPDS